MTDDPTAIRSLAVRVDDIVNALEAAERGRADGVLRVTPPFNGRMRARLHVTGDDEYEPGTQGAPIHVCPERFLDDPPPFPTPDETADELRDDPDREYEPEIHRSYHERRVERWRKAIAESICDRATIETAIGPHDVDVAALGTWPPDRS